MRDQPGQCSTQFEHDEFVVYSVNQQQIRYLVEFTLPEDDEKNPDYIEDAVTDG